MNLESFEIFCLGRQIEAIRDNLVQQYHFQCRDCRNIVWVMSMEEIEVMRQPALEQFFNDMSLEHLCSSSTASVGTSTMSTPVRTRCIKKREGYIIIKPDRRARVILI